MAVFHLSLCLATFWLFVFIQLYFYVLQVEFLLILDRLGANATLFVLSPGSGEKNYVVSSLLSPLAITKEI